MLDLPEDLQQLLPLLKYHNHRIKRASFKRIYTVPVSEYDIENLKASFEDGILSIIVPLRQKQIEKSKVIMIE